MLDETVGKTVERLRMGFSSDAHVSSIYLILRDGGVVSMAPSVPEIEPRLEVGAVHIAPTVDKFFDKTPFKEYEVGREILDAKLLETSDGGCIIESGLRLDFDDGRDLIVVPDVMPFALAVRTSWAGDLGFSPEYEVSDYATKPI